MLRDHSQLKFKEVAGKPAKLDKAHRKKAAAQEEEDAAEFVKALSLGHKFDLAARAARLPCRHDHLSGNVDQGKSISQKMAMFREMERRSVSVPKPQSQEVKGPHFSASRSALLAHTDSMQSPSFKGDMSLMSRGGGDPDFDYSDALVCVQTDEEETTEIGAC